MNSKNVLDWLLEDSHPSIRYRTMVELQGMDPNARDARAAKASIPRSTDVKGIFARMHPEGFWLQEQPGTKKTVGDGVEYGSFATTHFCLSYLAELGMDREDPRTAMAAERYLSLQRPDGDFWQHFSCLYAYNIRTYLMLGYAGDPRLQKTIDLMTRTERPDGGYLCDMHEGRYKTKAVKSCIRGSVKALLVFSLLPELWGSERCQRLVDYFLRRECLFRLDRPNEPVNYDVTKTVFPVIWRAGLLDILLPLARMGYGSHRELKRAWTVLEGKKNADGRYVLDWTPTQALLKAGRRGEPNKWVTFYALLALKYRDEGDQ